MARFPRGQPLPPDALFPEFAANVAALTRGARFAGARPAGGSGLADTVLIGEWRDASAKDAKGAQPASTGELRHTSDEDGGEAANGNGSRAPDGGGGTETV